MSNVEIYGIEAILHEMYEEEEYDFHASTLGLAYVSSSSYATLNVCNGEFYHDDNIISHFSILKDGRMVMVCTDNEEGEHYYIAEG